MKWTTWRGRRPIGAKSNSCDGATGSNNAPRENSSPVHSRANLPASFCAAWIFAIRLDRDQALFCNQSRLRSGPGRSALNCAGSSGSRPATLLFLFARTTRTNGRLPSTELLAWCGGNDLDLLFLGLLRFAIASLLTFGHVGFSPGFGAPRRDLLRTGAHWLAGFPLIARKSQSLHEDIHPARQQDLLRNRLRPFSLDSYALVGGDGRLGSADPGTDTIAPEVWAGQFRSSTVPTTISAQPTNMRVGQRRLG